MHQAFSHLAKRTSEVQAALGALVREVEQQSEREAKLLERVAYGDAFDEEVAPVQERVVAAMQQVLELLDEADDALERARTTLTEIEQD